MLYISFIFIFVDSFLIDTIPFFIVLASKTKYKSNEVLVQSFVDIEQFTFASSSYECVPILMLL